MSVVEAGLNPGPSPSSWRFWTSLCCLSSGLNDAQPPRFIVMIEFIKPLIWALDKSIHCGLLVPSS